MEDDKLRRETLANDRKLRERGSTFHDHAHAALNDEAGGRYARTSPAVMIGSTPRPYGSLPPMPAGNPWSGPDARIEPPTGVPHRFHASPRTLGSRSIGCRGAWPDICRRAFALSFGRSAARRCRASFSTERRWQCQHVATRPQRYGRTWPPIDQHLGRSRRAPVRWRPRCTHNRCLRHRGRNGRFSIATISCEI
jgi:hypothetical protein